MTSYLLWWCLLVHAVHCSRLVPLSISPNSDESGKQSHMYPESDPDRHQNLISCSSAHCQPSLKISCKSVRKFLRKVANKQTDKQTNRQTTTKNKLIGGDNNTTTSSSKHQYQSGVREWGSVVLRCMGTFSLSGISCIYTCFSAVRRPW